MPLDSYAELLRYDGAVVQRDRRGRVKPCPIQPRDVRIIHDVSQHKFLTATQLLELHWPGGAPQVGRRRLTKLFEAGYLERFRPVTRSGGSFPWTYQLGKEGHRLLRETGAMDASARYEHRTIFDYRYALHELHLNAWVLAWRQLLGDALIHWQGETELHPPPRARHQETRLDDDRSANGLLEPQPRLVRPDALVEVLRRSGDRLRVFLIEYDRTHRVDKNFQKFRRYDALLCWWWRQTDLAHHDEPPYVIFICQDEPQREAFLKVADRELTGHLWHPSDRPADHQYRGRENTLFLAEADIHHT
jgi:hypothetical protein